MFRLKKYICYLTLKQKGLNTESVYQLFWQAACLGRICLVFHILRQIQHICLRQENTHLFASLGSQWERQI